MIKSAMVGGAPDSLSEDELVAIVSMLGITDEVTFTTLPQTML
jgi:hypothetical protein